MSRIDGHVHVFLPDGSAYPRTVDALAPPERAAPVEQLVETMAAAGVEGAVLVPLGPEDAYVARCLAEHPGRFVGVCVEDDLVSGRDGGAHPEQALARRLDAGGFRGLRVSWLGEPLEPLEKSPAWPMLRYMAEQGVVMWFYAPAAQLPLLAEAVERLPELVVVLNHLGFCPEAIGVDAYGRPHIDLELPPPTLPRVLALAQADNVYVMFSGLYGFSAEDYPYRDLTPVVRPLYEAFGAGRMLWASDFPWILERPGYKQLVSLPQLVLPELSGEELALLEGGTVQKIFPGGWQR